MRRHKLRIVCGCVPRRLLTPLFLLSVKSHAAVRRHKLHIVCGCGKPRRLLIPLFLTSVKSHAAIRLFACKRAHDGSLLLPTFYGIRWSGCPKNCDALNMPISILLYNAYGDILYISDKSKKIGKAKVKKSGIDKSSVLLYHCKIKKGRRNAVPFLSVCVIAMLKLRGGSCCTAARLSASSKVAL